MTLCYLIKSISICYSYLFDEKATECVDSRVQNRVFVSLGSIPRVANKHLQMRSKTLESQISLLIKTIAYDVT